MDEKLVPLGSVSRWKSGMAWESKSNLKTYLTNCTIGFFRRYGLF